MRKGLILVVEDDAISRLALTRLLVKHGYPEPVAAASGEDGLRLALENDVEFAVMDIRLKGSMDGVECAARIKQAKDIPIIYATATNDAEDTSRALKTKPYAIISKPVDFTELIRKIDAFFAKAELPG